MQLDDFRVPGKKLTVKGNLELRTEDIAGETSGSNSVEKGIKPKILRVSVIIPYRTESDLNALIKKAEAVNQDGERKIYTVTHRTANVAGIRQVKFFEHMNWNEDATMQMWQVSFSLQEYLSNPERKETRQQTGLAATDPAKFQQVLAQAEQSK